MKEKKFFAVLSAIMMMGTATMAQLPASTLAAEPDSAVSTNENNNVNSGNYGIYGDNIKWILDDNGTVLISGYSYMEKNNKSDTSPLASSLIKNVHANFGVESISDYAFASGNLSSITLPTSIKTIGKGAFWKCTNLTDIFYNGTEEEWNEIDIEKTDNESLENVTIHFSSSYHDENIVDSGFCGNLALWTLDNEGTLVISGTGYTQGVQRVLTNSNVENDYGDSPMENGHAFYIFEHIEDKIKKIIIEDGITSIGNEFFRNLKNLTSVKIGKGVYYIDEKAFLNCEKLAEIIGGENVEEIGKNAFNDTEWFRNQQEKNQFVIFNKFIIDGKKCTGDVIIPDGIKCIDESAFAENLDIQSVTFPDSLTTIEDYAFNDCFWLKNIAFSDSIETIGQHAFDYTSWLDKKRAENPLVIVHDILIDGTICKGDVVIPENVKTIAESAFYQNKKINSLVLSKGVEEIKGYAFLGCENLSSVILPEGLKNIGDSAFFNCYGLKKLELSDGLLSIGDSAFQNCHKLTSVVLPQSLRTLDSNAFYNCFNLKSVTIPKNIELINYNVFNETSIFNNMHITDVYYSGSKTDWFYITIEMGNDALTNAAIHYNYGETSSPEATLAGDANCDGKVSIADATAILQAIGNPDKYALSEQGMANADVDGESGVTTSDGVAVKKFDAKKITELPIKL